MPLHLVNTLLGSFGGLLHVENEGTGKPIHLEQLEIERARATLDGAPPNRTPAPAASAVVAR